MSANRAPLHPEKRARFFSYLLWILLITAPWIGLSCHNARERHYDLKGTVVTVDTKQRQVTISHEDIPGYMNAMTMPFSLKDEWVYTVITVGDQVQAQLVVQGDHAWLEEVTISS